MCRGAEREFVPRKAQNKPAKEPQSKLSRANFEGAVRAFLRTPKPGFTGHRIYRNESGEVHLAIWKNEN